VTQPPHRPHLPDADAAKWLGREAVDICAAGRYLAPSGRPVSIRDALARAVDGTREYDLGWTPPSPPPPRAQTVTLLRNQTTLAAARDLVVEKNAPVALNFAAATHPGGGFRSGATAQEESLAWSSGLFACLKDRTYYRYHRAHPDPMHTEWAIYSPDVPVFRNDEGDLLEHPWECAFITCAAPNARRLRAEDPAVRARIREVMAERVRRVLSIATCQGHAAIVLGAWGCGAFGCNPDDVAPAFAAALTGPYAGVFERVTFAILDTSADESGLLAAFRRHLRSGGLTS
jgi:uncharacterized protein (TIGR02452 family)